MARDRAGTGAGEGFVHLRVRSAYSLLEGAIKADVVGKMAADAGMLFLYDPPQNTSMWMFQTLIPLDMLFIGADGRVVNIHERAVPGSTATISSAGPVRAVLELNGGTVARLKLKPGDRVRHAEIAK